MKVSERSRKRSTKSRKNRLISLRRMLKNPEKIERRSSRQLIQLDSNSNNTKSSLPRIQIDSMRKEWLNSKTLIIKLLMHTMRTLICLKDLLSKKPKKVLWKQWTLST